MRMVCSKTAAALLFALFCGMGGAQAQSVEDFYRGKSLKLLVSAAVGGGADLGRGLAEERTKTLRV